MVTKAGNYFLHATRTLFEERVGFVLLLLLWASGRMRETHTRVYIYIYIHAPWKGMVWNAAIP